jgi:hypothetical protein
MGIVLFTVLANNETFSAWLLLFVPGELLLVLAISVAGCLLLALLMEHLNHHVKYVPIVALMMAIYAGAKMLHLSPLIFVLLFGIMVNNVERLSSGRLARFFRPAQMVRELEQFKHLVAEGTFLVRGIFFILFGYSVEISALMDAGPFWEALFVLGIISSIRAGYFWFFYERHLLPLVFVLPRGLITVLLYLSIPAGYLVPGFGTPAVMWLVLQSCTLMMLGLMFSGSGTDETVLVVSKEGDTEVSEPTAPFSR